MMFGNERAVFDVTHIRYNNYTSLFSFITELVDNNVRYLPNITHLPLRKRNETVLVKFTNKALFARD